MQLNIVSYNGTTDINNGTTYKAWYEQKQQFVPTRQGIYAERPEKWQKLSGAKFDEHAFVFKVQCLGTIHTQRETVKGWFNSEDFTPRNLVFADDSSTGGGVNWYLQGIPVKVFEETPGILAVTLATDEPYLRASSDSTSTWSVTGTGETTSVTVDGNMNARPVITLTPTSAKAGTFGYRRWVSVYNPSTNGMANYPLDFGGIDTDALISANKMSSDGVDYILEMDGNITDYWLGASPRGIGSTNTALWGIIDLSPKCEAPLAVALTTDTALSEVSFTWTTKDYYEALWHAKDAHNKVFLIDNEAFTYSSISFSGVGVVATLVERGAFGTTIATHTANTTCRFLEHNIWTLYGSSDYGMDKVTSTNYYTVDDDNKPMFDLQSDNTSWIYTTFRQMGKSRPGQWMPQIVNDGFGNLCKTYTGNQASSTNPVTDMGMIIRAYNNSFGWQRETGKLFWKLHHPGGITDIQATGEKRLVSFTGTLWPVTAGLEYQHPTTKLWETADNQTIPTTNTWQAFTIASTDTGDLGLTTYDIHYILYGTVYGAANNYAALEIDACTLALDSAGVPQVAVGAEQTTYLMDARITNVTTGEWIRIRAVTGLNKSIIIDCDNKTISSTDGTNLRAGLSLSTPRGNWLDLQPGANTLRYTETGVAAVTVGIDFEPRNTL